MTMGSDQLKDTHQSFLGTGWSFPPRFSRETGQVAMTSDEQDIKSSLEILFGTTRGERLFQPEYGLDMHELLFEPMSTTLRSFLKEQIKLAILLHEPRINVLSLTIETPNPNDGTLRISVDYAIRATNSRFNLVFPFYLNEGNEARASAGVR
jgi:uncharacterized protein